MVVRGVELESRPGDADADGVVALVIAAREEDLRGDIVRSEERRFIPDRVRGIAPPTCPNGERNFPAVIKLINAAGPLVRVALVSDWGAQVNVELTQERYRELALKTGDRVFINPREMTVFVGDYMI